MAYDPNNIFARMVRGEIPCIRVFEDADTIAFMDIMPQADGHTLVIPKVAGENLYETVFHLHFHIVPVYAAGGWRPHARDKADPAVLEDHARRIRAALA